MPYLPLSDYGLIGNLGSAAIVNRMGSIEWCCLPYLDSASHFSGLLDENVGGRFQVVPVGEFRAEQGYVHRTNVLETRFETHDGRGVLIDWMPMESDFARSPIIHRRVEMIEGEISWSVVCMPRFAYGAEFPQAEQHRDGVLFRGKLASDIASLYSEVPLKISPNLASATATFKLAAGENRHFSWVWGRQPNRFATPSPQETIRVWQQWGHHCTSRCFFAGPWHDTVARSDLILRLLTTDYAGSIASAATTSLPTPPSGTQNTDRRYAWIRDAAFTLQGLMLLGRKSEASSFFAWLSDLVIRDGAEGLQSVYTLDGSRSLAEQELHHLSGYEGIRPVRVGNHSARQFHLDIFGHVMLAAALHFQASGSLPDGLWARLKELADHVCQAWRRPDKGPWEVRSKAEHFVASKVLCWMAIDRASWLAERIEGVPPSRWRHEQEILKRTICEQGYDPVQETFVRSFGSREVDASVMLIPLLGFLPMNDPRVLGTMIAIQNQLSDGVLVRRSQPIEGFGIHEHTDMTCSFWLVSCLALSGRADEASDRLAELCTYANLLGLFTAGVDSKAGELSGDFPYSPAHLALVNASAYVGVAKGRKLEGVALIGLEPAREDRTEAA